MSRPCIRIPLIIIIIIIAENTNYTYTIHTARGGK